MATDAIRTVTHDPGTVSRSGSGKAASITEAYAHNASRVANSAATKGDRLEPSDKGRLLGEAAGLIKRLNALSDVRPEAVERARRMIESGELFCKDAIRQAAEGLKRFLDHQGD